MRFDGEAGNDGTKCLTHAEPVLEFLRSQARTKNVAEEKYMLQGGFEPLTLREIVASN